MAHNFGHIILYRPFLHYLAKTKSENPPDARLLRCATSCVKISRFTISRSEEMLRQGFLAPAAWQSVYTVFLSVVTLIFFLATQHGNREYAAIQKETETGIRILASTSCQDIGSRRCLDVLRVCSSSLKKCPYLSINAIQVLTKRLSHIIDVPVEEISIGVTPLCKIALQTSKEKEFTPRTVEEDSGLFVHDTSVRSTTSETPQIPGGRPQPQPHQQSQQQQFPHRSQVRPQQTAPISSHLGNMPMYPSPAMPYPPQISMWEQSAGVPGTAPSPYLLRQSFQHGTPPAASETTESYTQSDMEVPYTGEFAWPFQMTGHDTGQESHSSQQGSHPLTQEDIAAFMRINPGDEPFL